MNVLKMIDGEWSGRILISEKGDSSDSIFHNVSVKFCYENERKFSSIKIMSEDQSFEKDFFLKTNGEFNDTYTFSDRFNEDIGLIRIHENKDSVYYILRGIISPKNDQITAIIREEYISIAITDQFSSNTTTISLSQRSGKRDIPSYMKTILLAIVCITILVGLVKSGDLADVIKPDEGKYAEMAKMKARRDEKIKEFNQKLAQQQENGNKIKTE